MIYIVVIAAAVLLSAIVFFFYPRKVEKHSKEPSGTVSCRHCGSRISVSSPSKLHHEFSVRCTACGNRKIYSRADLAR
jgi:DNA-directed RNA polymerase subunit RPC12/RpoP